MKNKYVVAPGKCESYLTPGRKYKIIGDTIFYFNIKDDDGNTLFCVYKNSAHLFGGDWIIVNE